jgi:hypothetical protein
MAREQVRATQKRMLVDAVFERWLAEVTGLPFASQVRPVHRSRRTSPILSAVGTAIPESFGARVIGLPARPNAIQSTGQIVSAAEGGEDYWSPSAPLAQSYACVISEWAPHGLE